MRPLRRPLHDDAGAMTLWLLGLALALLAVGGISLDLWRVTTQRRVLAAAVDSAAAAGAGVLDVDQLRATDAVRLDPDGARRQAEAAMTALAPEGMTAYAVEATADSVAVVAVGRVPVSLLRLVLPDAGTITVEVRAVAAPRASP